MTPEQQIAEALKIMALPRNKQARCRTDIAYVLWRIQLEWRGVDWYRTGYDKESKNRLTNLESMLRKTKIQLANERFLRIPDGFVEGLDDLMKQCAQSLRPEPTFHSLLRVRTYMRKHLPKLKR